MRPNARQADRTESRGAAERGAGPAAGNVREIAGQIAPDTRVAYIDNDPIVHVHANALLTGSGSTSIVLAGLREPQAILARPKVGALIGFSQPVALLLVAIEHFITAAENPADVLAAFRDALPTGSYFALPHATADFRPAAARHAAAGYDQATSTVTLRTHAQVAALFDGWDLVERGLVQVPLWRLTASRPPEGPGQDLGLWRRRPKEHMTAEGRAPARAPTDEREPIIR